MVTQVSQRLIEFLKAKESLSLTAYILKGESTYTIGWGNKYYEDGSTVRYGSTITLTRANQLFINIVNGFAKSVRSYVKSNVNQSQFDALVSYAYNRGLGKFRNTELLNMVNANPNNPKIRQQFEIEWGTNSYYKDSIISRRRQEANLYFSGTSATTSIAISSTTILLLGLIIILFLNFKNNQNEDENK